MLIGARTTAWGGKALPYDAEVEYLQGDGLAYIDTGIIYSTSNKYLITAHCKNAGTTGQYNYFMGWGAGGAASIDVNTWGDGLSSGTLGGDVSVKTLISILINAGSNSSTLSSANPGNTNLRVSHSYLLNYSGGIGYPLFAAVLQTIGNSYRCIIYDCQIYVNDVLERDLISVKKNNVGYMFDRCGSICPLTGTPLYANAGTGAFTWEELNA